MTPKNSTKLLFTGTIFAVFLLFTTLLINNQQNRPIATVDVEPSAREIVIKLRDSLYSWNSDAYISECMSNEFARGEFLTFSCDAYSPSDNQAITAIWSQGEIKLSNPITLSIPLTKIVPLNFGWENLESISSDLEFVIQDIFSNNPSFADLSLKVAIGADTFSRFNKLVWLIEIYDNEDIDEDGIVSKVFQTFLDAVSLEELN